MTYALSLKLVATDELLFVVGYVALDLGNP